jgi:RHS repeat-associated protein
MNTILSHKNNSMKKLLLYIVLFPVLAIGQTQTMNYIKSTTYKTSTTVSIASPTPIQAIQNISYLDDLGRPIQNIASKQSGSGKNIVTHIEYDVFGRQTKDFLPYPTQSSTGLNYESSASTDVLNYAPYSGQNPFSEKQIEASPLDKVLAQGAAGNSWALGSGHEIKTEYLTNSANEVKYYKAVSTWNSTTALYDISFVDAGYYPVGGLYKTIVKNENWKSLDLNNNTKQEFVDNEGKTVLVRTFNNNDPHDIYYVYDQFGNLTYVLPPMIINPTSEMDALGYQYKFDRFNRPVAKKLPGKPWEFTFFDKMSRPVATGHVYSPWGDGSKGILVTEYDVQGRVVKTGWLNQTITETSRKNLQDSLNNGTNPFTLGANDILTQNYYDNYSFSGAPSPVPSTLPDSTYPIASNVKGLATGTWVKILDSVNPNQYELSYTLYDDKFRPVRNYTKNYTGGYTQIDSKIDFSGKKEYTVTTHKRLTSDTEIKIRDNFTYSDQDRLVLHIQKINNDPEQLIAKNSYNELGELISKNVGGTDSSGATGLQKVDYTYNIRGWLKSINDVTNLTQGSNPQDLFAFKINYQDNSLTGGEYTVPQLFNGNISEVFWRTNNDNVLRKYGYNYDDLNRMVNATYQKPGSSVVVTNSYNESLSYDKNGNIYSLERTGEYDDSVYQLMIDKLTYTYSNSNSNQLVKIFDETNNAKGFLDDSNGFEDIDDDFTYDEFGNLLSDTNKGIGSITYNHLNLPVQIDVYDKQIKYIYDASGKKVKKNAPEYLGGFTGYVDKVIDYTGGFQYRDGVLIFFSHDEGYVNVLGNAGNQGNEYHYVFNYKDHLGNVRLSYGYDPSTSTVKILEEDNYYPFGLKHNNYNISQKTYVKNGLGDATISTCNGCPIDYKYKYNGKEFQDELGLNFYDYGARNYDPAIGRWMNIDPLAEASRRFSTYTYANNNPIFFVDPDGRYTSQFDNMNPNQGSGQEYEDPGDYYNIQGQRLGSDGKDDDKAYLAEGKNDDGTFKNAEQLSVSNSVLNQFANTVAQESSGQWKESYGIASAIVNLSKYKNKDIETTIKTEGIFGYKDGGYSTKYKNNAEFGMEAALNALRGGKDYSKGAVRWDGFDLAKKGLNQVKARFQGLNINPKHLNTFGISWV